MQKPLTLDEEAFDAKLKRPMCPVLEIFSLDLNIEKIQ